MSDEEKSHNSQVGRSSVECDEKKEVDLKKEVEEEGEGEEARRERCKFEGRSESTLSRSSCWTLKCAKGGAACSLLSAVLVTQASELQAARHSTSRWPQASSSSSLNSADCPSSSSSQAQPCASASSNSHLLLDQQQHQQQQHQHNSNQQQRTFARTTDPEGSSLPTLLTQLLALVCALLLLLYTLNALQRVMTNILAKILGTERRRSLASNAHSQAQHQPNQPMSTNDQTGLAHAHSSSTLSLPRNSSPSCLNAATSSASHQHHQRRTSKSSIHSVSAMLISAITGGQSSRTSSNNNGRSMIAKNKEDTVVLASSSSPTIIQKESTEGGGASSPVVGAGSVTPASNSCSPAGTSAGTVPALSSVSATANVSLLSDADAELERALYDSVTRTNASGQVTLGGSSVIAAAAAALNLGGGCMSQNQLPTVSTQPEPLDQLNSSPSPSPSAVQSAHAPLNSSSTMKQVAPPSQQQRKQPQVSLGSRRLEIIKTTETLLNALNLGDYETYTRLCDPHMTSFEPENLGQLVDNMEYRRLCLDQARQLQLHQLQQQLRFQSQTVSAAAIVATQTALAQLGLSNSPIGGQVQENQAGKSQQQLAKNSHPASASPSPSPSSQNSTQQATNSSCSPSNVPTPCAGLSLPLGFSQPSTTTTTTNLSAFPVRSYSLMLNPSVYLISDEAASIAYTKLSQRLDLTSGQMSVEQSEETRIWHKKPDPHVAPDQSVAPANRWLCVHLHSSLVHPHQQPINRLSSPQQYLDHFQAPQTSLALIRSMTYHQQLASLFAIQQQQQQQQQQTQQQPQLPSGASSVPLISLNSSSAGTTTGTNVSQTSHQSNNTSR